MTCATIDVLSNDTFDAQAVNSGDTTLQVIATSNGISLDATTGNATVTATDAQILLARVNAYSAGFSGSGCCSVSVACRSDHFTRDRCNS